MTSERPAAWEYEKVRYPTRAGFWDSLWRLLRGERLERWVEVCAECGDYGEGCKSCGRALVDLSALREKHDPVARNLVTVWRSELLALIEIAEAAHAFLASGDETQAHARLNAALDLIDFGADRG